MDLGQHYIAPDAHSGKSAVGSPAIPDRYIPLKVHPGPEVFVVF